MKNVIMVFGFLFLLMSPCLNYAHSASINEPTPEFQESSFLKVLSPQHVWYAVESIGWSPNNYYHRYSVEATSIVINNKSYQQILTSPDSTGNQWKRTKKYAREADGKLWLIDSTYSADEVCIMDMNLNKGDEFLYKSVFAHNVPKLWVSKVDSVSDLNGQMRKVIHLTCGDDQGFRYSWIEGVGPDAGVFNSSFLHCLLDGNENDLTCFYDADVQKWQSEDYKVCWKPAPPTLEPLMKIINSKVTRYMVINKPFFPHQKMERWKFNFLATVKENANAYYELLVSDQKDGAIFQASGRFYREENNRFYQYISPSAGERLLYDMNLKQGDSIRVDYADGPRLMVVTKEDSIQLDDPVFRKRLTLQCIRDGVLESGEAAQWIEGIGRLHETFVDFSHCSIWDKARPEVYCIYDQTNRLYKSKEAPSDCWIEEFYETDLDSSAIWYSSSYIGNWADGDCHRKIDITKIVRDTTILYRKCKIMGVSTDGKDLPESEIITFQKAEKFYFYENGTWKLLYDFAARVGDTVTYFVSKKYPFYGKFAVPTPFVQSLVDDNPYQLVIKNIDIIYDASGKPLKKFYTENISNVQGHFMGEIIENMGSVEKLFGNNITIIPPMCDPNEGEVGLRCYSDDDTFIKFTNEACDKIVSSQDISVGNVIVFPNPGQDVLHIVISDHMMAPVNIQISDISSRTIINTNAIQANCSINTLLLNSGLFVITLRDQQGKLWHSKWVKE